MDRIDRDKKQNNRFVAGRLVLYTLILVAFIVVIVVYYRMLYNETRENIIAKGRNNATETANKLDRTLSSYIDILRLASYSLDNMIREDRTNDEILDYLSNETVAFRDSMSSETTGLYGYINGVYMDGSGWVPDEDYEPTQRPWYKQTKAGNGKIVLGDPYLDMDTGNYTITIGKVLCDAKSILAVDLFLNQLQVISDEHADESDIISEIIVNVRGEIMTHPDKSRIRTYIGDSTDPIDVAVSEKLDRDKESFFYMQKDGRDYIVYIMPLQYNWLSVSVIDATDDFEGLRIPLILTIFTALVVGFALGFFMITSDKRRREARALAIESERANAASEAKSEFLSNMSHEIRTPINAILGMNEMVLRVSEDKEVTEYSENIRNAGNTLLGIVNDILDFSKIEAGKMEIIPVEYEVSSMLNDLVTMIDFRAKNKGLKLITAFDGNMPKRLFGDVTRIKQVIMNLLTNAVKYTEKGSVTFEVGFERVPDDNESVFLKVFVRDTGIGIRKEDMDKLCAKFERIDEDRNRNIEGTGLGMSISMNLVRMMGSTLEMKSAYGKGSSFGFRLKQEVILWDPIGDYEETVKENGEPHRKYREKFTAPQARILVVDDNPMNLKVFASLIKKTQVKTDTCESGDEAIRMSSAMKYDMIFLDHMMPHKDGIETLQEIRRNPNNPNNVTPTICLTANAISGAKEMYIEAGFNDYLSKPIEPDRLEDMMLEYLPEDIVIPVTADKDVPEEEAGAEPIPDDLAALCEKGIDVSAGIRYSGDEQSYREMLRVYKDSVSDRSKEITDYYNSKDYKNYTIKVHGLKSSSKIIGAVGFGEMAQKMEDAGKSGDEEYIASNHEELIREYERLGELIGTLTGRDEPDGNRYEADSGTMNRFYSDVIESAEAMDCERLESIISKMNGYRIPEADRELFDKIRTASDNFEYSAIIKMIANRRG